jgi:cyclohexadieny/prephenate dehydrogenase
MKPEVAIVGLGQIGGSLAAALTRRGLARVTGITRRPATARRARRLGLLAAASIDPCDAAGADLVVLATPVRTLLRQVPEFAARLGPDAILSDVGSTKAQVVRAFRTLPRPGPALVAGHPMAGNERAGLDGVDPGLFRGRPWVLIPARPADRRRAGLLDRLVRGVGARPLWMGSAEEHDYTVACVSHVPHLLAYALMGSPEAAIRVSGNSFRDATRVAASDVDMVLDFLLTNASLERAGRDLIARLRGLLSSLKRGEAGRLRALLSRARARRGGL